MENKEKLIEQKIALLDKISELAISKTARIREYLKLKEKYERDPKDSGLPAEDQIFALASNITGLFFRLPEKQKELNIFIDKIDSEIDELKKEIEVLVGSGIHHLHIPNFSFNILNSLNQATNFIFVLCNFKITTAGSGSDAL